MRDFNFFSEYVYFQDSSLLKKLMVPLLLIIILSLLAYVYYYMEANLAELQDTYDANNMIIESKKYKEIVEEENALRTKLEQMINMQLELVAFEELRPYKYRVEENLLENILGTVPRNVAFNSYTISPLGVTISATSSDYSYIAELEYNLRSLDIFENIFIRGVENNEEDGYTFNIELIFGGDLNE